MLTEKERHSLDRNRLFFWRVFGWGLRFVVALTLLGLFGPLLVVILASPFHERWPAGVSTSGIFTECVPTHDERIKECLVDPQDGRKPFRNIAVMSDWEWAESQDQG